MAFTSGFFNGLDRKYDAIQISSLFDGIINDGVFSNVGEKFIVKEKSNTEVTIGSGRAWFDHTWSYNDAQEVINIDPPEALLNRYDAIVLEMDLMSRENHPKYIKGTPASVPVEPAYINNALLHQVPIASMYRRAGATNLLQENITNKVGTSSCPLVTAVNQSMTVDELMLQWTSKFGEWMDNEEYEFSTWFETIRGQLTSDAAGNLQNQVNLINNRFGSDIVISYVNPPAIEAIDYGIRKKITIPPGMKFCPADGLNIDGTVKQVFYTTSDSRSIEITVVKSPENLLLFIDSLFTLHLIKNDDFKMYDKATDRKPVEKPKIYYVVNEGKYYKSNGEYEPSYTVMKMCYLAALSARTSMDSEVVVDLFRYRTPDGLNRKLGVDALVHKLGSVGSGSGGGASEVINFLDSKQLVPSMEALREIKDWPIEIKANSGFGENGMVIKKMASGELLASGITFIDVSFPLRIGATDLYYNVFSIPGPGKGFVNSQSWGSVGTKVFVDAYASGISWAFRGCLLPDGNISVTIIQYGNATRNHKIDWLILSSWNEGIVSDKL